MSWIGVVAGRDREPARFESHLAGRWPNRKRRWAASSFVGPNVVVRPIKEEMTSRSALIFPFPGARLALAEAFAKDLKEEIRKAG